MCVCMCAVHVSQMLYVSGLSHERKLLVLYLFVRGSTRFCQKVSDSVLCGFHNFSTNLHWRLKRSATSLGSPGRN